MPCAGGWQGSECDIEHAIYVGMGMAGGVGVGMGGGMGVGLERTVKRTMPSKMRRREESNKEKIRKWREK